MLHQLGYSVVTATDAASALCVLESGLPVDLLLSDVVMPGPLSSVELARKAQALYPRMAVLFASGYMPDHIVRDRQFDQMRELLPKPFSRDELAWKVGRVLERRDDPRGG